MTLEPLPRSSQPDPEAGPGWFPERSEVVPEKVGEGSGDCVKSSGDTPPWRMIGVTLHGVVSPEGGGVGSAAMSVASDDIGAIEAGMTLEPLSVASAPASASASARTRLLKNSYFTEMCSGSETGSYLRLIDFCITQL